MCVTWPTHNNDIYKSVDQHTAVFKNSSTPTIFSVSA